MENFKREIRKVKLFDIIPPDDLDAILKLFHEVNFKAGETIYEESSTGEDFYIILSGTIDIFQNLQPSMGTGKVKVNTLVEYNFFGEMALFDDFTRQVTAIAITDCRLLALKRDDFRQLFLRYPDMFFNLMNAFFIRSRKTNNKYQEFIQRHIKKSHLLAIGDATSKIIHDIKTPISITILTAELIADMYPETKEFTNKIKKQAKDLDDLVREILDFATNKKSFLNIQECSIEELLNELKSTILPIAEVKLIDISFIYAQDFIVEIDKNKIRRAIINILNNAIEATDEYEKISVTISKNKPYWKIEIRDTGKGIPEDILENMFDVFFSSEKEYGSGLGLSICQKIIQDHNGTIFAENHNEGGAVFTINLPLVSRR